MIGIYKIENILNNNKYIGKSKDIDRRFYGHRNQLNLGEHHCKYLQYAWNKYGENNFIFEVIEECSSQVLDELELHYIRSIATYNNDNINKTNSYGMLWKKTCWEWNKNGYILNDLLSENLLELTDKNSFVEVEMSGSANFWDQVYKLLKKEKLFKTHKLNTMSLKTLKELGWM